MSNDLSSLMLLSSINMCDMEKLTNAEYDTLRDLAARYLTYQTLFQCLAPKLPYKPGVKEAWETLADCIMCDEEEVKKRRELEREVTFRMRRAEAEHNQRKREQYEERKKTIAAALGQQYKLQKVVDELQQSMSDLQDQLRTLQ
jgi:hypothetical protein